jgi:hypothetical protein
MLARALGNIQHDRERCARELIPQMAPPSRQSLNDSVREDQKFQRQVVNVQPFMIEHHERSLGSLPLRVAQSGHGHVYVHGPEFRDTP